MVRKFQCDMERKLEKRFRILLKNNNTLMGKTVNYLIILFLYKLKEIRSDLQQQVILEGPCLVHTKGVHIRGHLIIVLMDNFNLFYFKYINCLSSIQILDYYQTLK